MQLHIAYVAGYLDADGTITAHFQPQREARWVPALGIDLCFFSQNHEVLEQIQSILERGKIRVVLNGLGSGCYRLEFSRRDTKHILELLLPYLCLKREQATLALVGISTVGKGPKRVTAEVQALRKTIVAQISKLNQRDGKVFRTKWVNSGKPSSVVTAGETIPSQASEGSAPAEGSEEGVTTRLVSPNNNPAHERPPRKGRDSLSSVVTRRSAG